MLWHPNKVTEQERPISLSPRVGRKEVAGEGLRTGRRRRKKTSPKNRPDCGILPRGPPTPLFVSRDKMGRGEEHFSGAAAEGKEPCFPTSFLEMLSPLGYLDGAEG